MTEVSSRRDEINEQKKQPMECARPGPSITDHAGMLCSAPAAHAAFLDIDGNRDDCDE
jgi:hypothetical protein